MKKKVTENQEPSEMESYMSTLYSSFNYYSLSNGKIKFKNEDKFKGMFKDGRPSGYG